MKFIARGYLQNITVVLNPHVVCPCYGMAQQVKHIDSDSAKTLFVSLIRHVSLSHELTLHIQVLFTDLLDLATAGLHESILATTAVDVK